jgi:hypothetical protein
VREQECERARELKSNIESEFVYEINSGSKRVREREQDA